MKVHLIFLLLIFLALPCLAQSNQPSPQKTWTYTYLQAKSGQKDNLKRFIEKNWFAMDSIAVQQGLFNDYQLLENANRVDSSSWDFIVAVEYYTPGTYSDIAAEWAEIRNKHQVVLIDGFDFPQLGQVVNSDQLTRHTYNEPVVSCAGRPFEMLQPFLGLWQEYLVTEEGENLYGQLSIAIDPMGCSLQKNFQLFTHPFTYSTLGYFDTAQDCWVETYVFSNGQHAIYQWVADQGDFLLTPVKPSSPEAPLSRNRWTQPTDQGFQIRVEQSKDQGKTWEVTSVTQMKRISMD